MLSIARQLELMLEFNDTLATFKSITDQRLREIAAEHLDAERLTDLTRKLDLLFSELQAINETLFQMGIGFRWL
ncbi:MAG TPA: hypothetical protein VFL72_01240 [Acidimicrobiia bacterium]|nr:hypothetical protein [Acidimicrobiia bacterium]